jgi:acyl phosphate:glycerol-3-phosphate acyltransferase
MHWIMALAAILIGYVLGSVPVGVLACRLYGVDIRKVGSGRTGTTNAWRAAGLKAAIPTVIGDAIKGAVAIWIVTGLFLALFPEPATMSVDEAVSRTSALHLSQALAGGFAILGHNWSAFLGFKGGAGGITAAATTMALYPPVGGMVWLIGGILFWWSRIASVATFSVGVSAFAIFLMLAVDDWVTYWPYAAYGIIALAAVMLALRPNRDRLKDGSERVVTLW